MYVAGVACDGFYLREPALTQRDGFVASFAAADGALRWVASVAGQQCSSVATGGPPGEVAFACITSDLASFVDGAGTSTGIGQQANGSLIVGGLDAVTGAKTWLDQIDGDSLGFVLPAVARNGTGDTILAVVSSSRSFVGEGAASGLSVDAGNEVNGKLLVVALGATDHAVRASRLIGQSGISGISLSSGHVLGAFADGTIAVCGSLYGTADLGTDAGTFTTNGTDGFVLALDPTSLATTWGTSYGGEGIENCVAAAIDAKDDVLYVAGTHEAQSAFTIGTQTVAGAPPLGDGGKGLGSHIAKIDRAGKVLWAATYSSDAGGARLELDDIAATPTPSIVVDGTFRGTFDLGYGDASVIANVDARAPSTLILSHGP